MFQDHPAWIAHQRARWLRPDVHLFVRPDACRFMPPGAPRLMAKTRCVTSGRMPLAIGAQTRSIMSTIRNSQSPAPRSLS
jgi:hypothetical protein